jgi:hypothetical protein
VKLKLEGGDFGEPEEFVMDAQDRTTHTNNIKGKITDGGLRHSKP